MANPYFRLKKFTVHHDRCAMKVTTDACLFGAWVAEDLNNSATRTILDIGTGTGLLSLMIAQKTRDNIVSVEIDKEATEQAKENIAQCPWNNRIRVFHQDVKDHSGQYDVVVSNPPFYENEISSSNPLKNLAHHNAGLSFPDLMTVINKVLRNEGIFYFLLPAKRWKDLRKIIQSHKFCIRRLVMVKPTPSHEYSRVMVQCSRLPGELKSGEICIKDEDDAYTPDFIHLLKDYYLYLPSA